MDQAVSTLENDPAVAVAAESTKQAGGRDLTSGPIASTLLMFALPTLGANILQSLNGSINAIWVGNFLGEAALAATSNANLIMMLMFSGVFGLAMAATIMIGQSMGAHNVDAARRTLGGAMGSILVIGVIVAFAGWLLAPHILDALATPPEAMVYAVAYLRVIFAALPFMFVTVLLGSAMRGAGDPVTPLRGMILTVALDAGLNPVFIRGLGPVPEMGIAGSAVATLIAHAVTAAFLIFYIYRKDLILRLRGAELSYLRPQADLSRMLIVKGIPMGLTMVAMTLSLLLMMGLVNRYGTDTTAAYGAISQLWAYVQMPAMAVGAAASAMAAQNVGAGRWERVDRVALTGAGINVVMTGLIIAFLTIADRTLLGLFLPGSGPAVAIGQHIHLLASWSFLLFGISIVYASVVRATGAVFVPLLLLIIALFPVRLGFAFAMMPVIGPDALWLGFPAGSIASVIMSILYFRYGGWRRATMQLPS